MLLKMVWLCNNQSNLKTGNVSPINCFTLPGFVERKEIHMVYKISAITTEDGLARFGEDLSFHIELTFRRNTTLGRPVESCLLREQLLY